MKNTVKCSAYSDPAVWMRVIDLELNLDRSLCCNVLQDEDVSGVIPGIGSEGVSWRGGEGANGPHVVTARDDPHLL